MHTFQPEKVVENYETGWGGVLLFVFWLVTQNYTYCCAVTGCIVCMGLHRNIFSARLQKLYKRPPPPGLSEFAKGWRWRKYSGKQHSPSPRKLLPFTHVDNNVNGTWSWTSTFLYYSMKRRSMKMYIPCGYCISRKGNSVDYGLS